MMIAIYARQSIEKKDSISIDSQIELAKREIFTDDYKIYQDAGYSGKNTNRPAFNELMQDVKNGLIDQVVVYRLDRISRSILDFSDFISVLEDHNVSFISATEKFDTSNPMGRAMLYIIVVFAQLERETIAERVKDNYYARVKKGAWGGGPAAFGFDLVRTKIDGKSATMCTPNTDIAVVKRIFELYSNPNTSLADVQRTLIAEGIKSTNGVNINTARISLILKNPTYVCADVSIMNYYHARGVILENDPEDFDGVHGCILVGKRNANDRKYTDVSNHLLAVGPHEGIIDSQTFLYCQQKLSNNKQIKNTYKGKHSWLTGLIKCGHCGYSMSVRVTQLKEGKVPYYYCSGKYLYRTCPDSKGHRANVIEEVVGEAIVSELTGYNLKRQTQNKSTSEIDLKIADIDARIVNLIRVLENSSDVSYSYINSRIESLHAEKQDLMHEVAKIIIENKSVNIPPMTLEEWNEMSFDRKRDIARSLISTVCINDTDIVINFK